MKNQTTQHKSIPLKQAVNEQVQNPSLAPDQLAQLLTMQHAVLDEPKRKEPRWLATAAIITMCMLGSLLGWQHWHDQQGLTQAIALEVVNNHLKQNPLDTHSKDMAGIRKYFTKLDFAPQKSTLLASINGDTTMLGGRYCSIQGVTATQLRYQRDTGITTLYEVGYDADQFGHIPNIDKGQQPLSIMQKGLLVNLWVEKGLLMVNVNEPI